MTGIAHQYALAVFSLAEEANRGKAFKKTLSEFVASLDEETYKFFNHPKVSRQDKTMILEKVIVNDTLLLNFLKVLVENQRFSLLEAILIAYQEILDSLDKIMKVKIISNKPLSNDNLKKIKDKLNKKYNRSIQIEEEIDSSIIGGFRIEFEGNIIDETINSQLEQLRTSLLE